MPANLPLLLLPGLLCDAALWQHQLKALKTLADCQVPDLTQQDRVDALARFVLAGAPPQFALGALSMGGYVAFEIMRQAPTRVLKLCLISTSSRADTPEQRQRRQLLMAMARKGEFKGVTPRLLPTLIFEKHLADKALTGVVTSMAERVGRDAFEKQQTAIFNRPDSRPFLKDIRCPTQVIGAREDALTPPPITREIAEGIPGARFDMIESCGHLAPLEKPEQVNQIMKRWLEM
ncbi:MAG: alpha/beta hydrolase [Pseudomonadota bacterium]|nr:alpha/beta hydrolase [Pseudomonadota bacterium]